MISNAKKLKLITDIQKGAEGSISYIYRDGSRLKSTINRQCLRSQKDTPLSALEVLVKFKEIADDYGAVKFYIST